MKRLIFAGILLVSAVLTGQESKPPELTPEQKLVFQSALTAFYLQTAMVSDLNAQFQRELTDKAKALQTAIANQTQAQSGAQEAVKAACPGILSGLLEGRPECKAKAPEAPKAPTKEGNK